MTAILVSLLVWVFYSFLVWAALKLAGSVPFVPVISFPQALAFVFIAWVILHGDWLGLRGGVAALAAKP
jgi:hypothetical protein